jgi:hypothetical protein
MILSKFSETISEIKLKSNLGGFCQISKNLKLKNIKFHLSFSSSYFSTDHKQLTIEAGMRNLERTLLTEYS